MIKRLLSKPSGGAGHEDALPSGRLITGIEVPSDRTARAELSEADVERIAASVAARLLQGSSSDCITRIVSEVAERLVREEIARMRAAAQSKNHR
ncbi:MAG: hypothetical protein ACRD2A_08500 [Vicinamibacterales bacterium]